MKPDLTKPSIKGLIYILRNQKEWPEDFEWDFSSHQTCALGLINWKWGNEDRYDILSAFTAAVMLDITEDQARSIFIDPNNRKEEVQPEHIAAQLEAL